MKNNALKVLFLSLSAMSSLTNYAIDSVCDTQKILKDFKVLDETEDDSFFKTLKIYAHSTYKKIKVIAENNLKLGEKEQIPQPTSNTDQTRQATNREDTPFQPSSPDQQKTIRVYSPSNEKEKAGLLNQNSDKPVNSENSKNKTGSLINQKPKEEKEEDCGICKFYEKTKESILQELLLVQLKCPAIKIYLSSAVALICLPVLIKQVRKIYTKPALVKNRAMTAKTILTASIIGLAGYIILNDKIGLCHIKNLLGIRD